MATLNVTAYSYGTSTYGSHEYGEDSLPIVISASASVACSSERIQQSALEISVTSGVATIGGFTAAADAIVSATSTTTCSGQRLALFPSGNIVATASVSITGNATFASGGSVTVTVASGVSAAGEKFILEETDAQGYGSYLYGVGVYDLSNLQTIISATATSTCVGQKISLFPQGTIQATSTVSAIARRIADGSVLINGTSVTVATSTGNGTRVRTSAAPMSSATTISAYCKRVRTTPVAISAVASVSANSVFIVNGAAALTGTATIAAICNRVRFGSGTPTANASITVLGFATRGGIASTGGTQHYNVTVQVVSGANKYFINGVQQQVLNLVEGNTYVFNYPSGHPFKFSTTSNGTHSGGSEYTTGVIHNSLIKTTIVVADNAPDLYYYCQNHSAMGGTANTPSSLVTSTSTCASQIILLCSATMNSTTSITVNGGYVKFGEATSTPTTSVTSLGRLKWSALAEGNQVWTPINNDSVTWTQIAA